ncbi:aminotransferase class III-fold pyridoxal phosphate-dependent enzyme, partial [Streptomyces sp. G35A]
AGDAREPRPAARRADSVLGGHLSGAPLPAGVVVEPVHGDGGVLPAPDAWLRRMRHLTADRSVPLIADETLTGVGRTGAFWAVEHSGVTPDVMVLSAAIGGSLPLAVVVHRDDLDTATSGPHRTGTFPGNQLALAAGTATLAHVRENGLAEHAATLGTHMLNRLRELTGEVACVGDVRGRGLMIGVELVDPEREDGAGGRGAGPRSAVPPTGPDPRRPAPPGLAVAVQRECLRRGLIVGLSGPCASVVRLLPPLTITEEQASAVLDRLADALQAAARTRTAVTAPEPRPHRHHRTTNHSPEDPPCTPPPHRTTAPRG